MKLSILGINVLTSLQVTSRSSGRLAMSNSKICTFPPQQYARLCSSVLFYDSQADSRKKRS